MKTRLARGNGITAVWYQGHVISAWYDDSGDSANLFMAHILTSSRTKPPVCEHGLSGNLCTVCPQDRGLWPVEE